MGIINKRLYISHIVICFVTLIYLYFKYFKYKLSCFGRVKEVMDANIVIRVKLQRKNALIMYLEQL